MPAKGCGPRLEYVRARLQAAEGPVRTALMAQEFYGDSQTASITSIRNAVNILRKQGHVILAVRRGNTRRFAGYQLVPPGTPIYRLIQSGAVRL